MKVKELLELVKDGSLLIEIDNTDVGFPFIMTVDSAMYSHWGV